MNGYVHYGLTKRWAMQEGFSPDAAEVIARADIAVDREFPGRQWSNKRYHFAWLGARRIGRAWLQEAMGTGDLVLLGRALHCEQDAISHGHIGHVVHWPGIDIWERRGARVRARIEAATRQMLVEYRRARPDADAAESGRETSATAWTEEDIL